MVLIFPTLEAANPKNKLLHLLKNLSQKVAMIIRILISFILSIALALFASRLAGKFEKRNDNRGKLDGLAVAASFDEKQIEERRLRAEKAKEKSK